MFMSVLLNFRLLHRIPKRECIAEKSIMYFFRSNVKPSPDDPTVYKGKKLSIQTQYGAIKHHTDSLFLELVLLLVSNSFPDQERIIGAVLNDQNCLEIWIQRSEHSSSSNVEHIKQFLIKHFTKLMEDIGIKESEPRIEEKYIFDTRASKKDHKS